MQTIDVVDIMPLRRAAVRSDLVVISVGMESMLHRITFDVCPFKSGNCETGLDFLFINPPESRQGVPLLILLD
jgi:hypothetical protein